MKKTIVMIGLAAIMGACSAPKEKNPFFSEYNTPYGVPPFDKIEFEHYKPAFERGMEEQRKEVEAIINNKAAADFENTIAALDQSGGLLRRVSAVFYGINGANTTDSIKALNRELSPLLSKHGDDINLNPGLFAKVKEVYAKKDQLKLTKEQSTLLEETYKSFVRGGANLNEEQQAELRKLNARISLLQITFEANVLDETNSFKLVLDKKEDLAGLPDSQIAAAAAAAKAAGMEGKWVFTLHNPSVIPFLQYSSKRDLREKIYNAYINRCNNDNKADNKAVVKELVSLRLEKAKLLGYEDFASFVLEDRMAKNAESVYNLLNQVWEPTLVKTKKELADLQNMMKKDKVSGELKAWDWKYYSNKVKSERFNFDENALRPYLKLENVRDGMFYVVNKLYGITFTELKDMPVYHDEVSVFECKDKDGSLLGIIYFDFFPRPGKRQGAWCTTYRSQTYKNGKRVAPVVTNVCNFSRPTGDQPALLTADEAETMFHEFGHALHHFFKDVHYYGVTSVPRDFVELPSQVMEHWTFEPEVLKVYAKHYETGEVIPTDLIEKMENSGKFGQGFATSEFVEAAILDMDYHVLKEIPADLNAIQFEADVMKRLNALSQIPARYRSTYFRHTMGGGYTAGYYSYMWSEVLDADAFSAFVETGDIFDQATAEKFRKYVLTPGGIDDAMTMYVNFRGKEPSIDPLLKNRGLK